MAATKNQTPKKKTKAWKSDSYDGALLFLLFHKQIDCHPDQFSPSDLQSKDWGFDQYNSQTFKKNSQTIANRVKQFEKNGASVLADRFRAFMKAVLEDKPDLFQESTEEEFDEDYQPEGDDDDISHISKAEDEESISDAFQDPRFDPGATAEQPPIDKSNILQTKRRSHQKGTTASPKKEATKSKATTSMKVQNNIPGKKSLTPYCDGRFCGRMMLSSDFNDATKFYVTLDGTKVMERTPKPSKDHPMMDSKVCFKRHGFKDDNIHIITNQADTDKQAKKEDAATKKDDYVERVIFEPPKKCKPYFLDPNGTKRDKVYIADDSDKNPDNPSEWVYFWIIDAEANEEEIIKASIDRSKKRNASNTRQTELEEQMAVLLGEMRAMRNEFDQKQQNGNLVVNDLKGENHTLRQKLLELQQRLGIAPETVPMEDV